MYHDDDGNELTWQMFYDALEMRVVARLCVWSLYSGAEDFEADADTEHCIDCMRQLSAQTARSILALHRFHHHRWFSRDIAALIAREVMRRTRALMWRPPTPTIVCPVPFGSVLNQMAKDHVKMVGEGARVVILDNMAIAGYLDGPILWALDETPIPDNFSRLTLLICAFPLGRRKIMHWIHALVPNGNLVVCRDPGWVMNFY
jgi:hypothetical protein